MGPVYKSKALEGGVLKLKFDNAAGLKTKDGQAPVHFYVSTASVSEFSAATAEIHGEEVWLTSELISAAESADALHVRYAFLYAAETNLENGAGLPAEPFRTDDWNNNESVKYIY
jgi:sialate O-acetylesterase